MCRTAYTQCLSVKLFGSSSCYQENRGSLSHCGYTAGIGGWAPYGDPFYWVRESEFDGITGDASKIIVEVDVTVWKTVKIELLQDGTNNYYLNDVLQKTTTNAGTGTEGQIALNGCATGQYKNLVVSGNQCTIAPPSSEPSLTPSYSTNPTSEPSTEPSSQPSSEPSSI